MFVNTAEQMVVQKAVKLRKTESGQIRSKGQKAEFVAKIVGAGGGIRTHTRFPSPVFETGASTIPPLRHGFEYSMWHTGNLIKSHGK